MPLPAACYHSSRRPRVVVSATAASPPPPPPQRQAPPFRTLLSNVPALASFRFWHDEQRFRRDHGDESLAQHTLLAAGGIRMGGNPKKAASQGLMGWQVPDRWDILWSTSDGAHRAAPSIDPAAGQLINALPGLESLTRKRNLPLTLQAAYGEHAWQLVPRTFSLPSQAQQWRQRLAAEAKSAAAGGGVGVESQSTGWWVLKTGQHRGQGLRVVPSAQALSAIGLAAAPDDTDTPSVSSSNVGSPSDSASSSSNTAATQPPAQPFIAVQQYITQPLLINRRKFGLRVWVLVIGPKPYRAYVYRQGLVLFSSLPYNADLSALATRGAASQGHLTNAALWGQPDQHSSSSSDGSSSSSSDGQQPVWSLQQLFDVLGPQQADAVWTQILDTAGKVVSSTAGPVADAAQQLQWDGDAGFELLGLDFLLDSACRPWLLEVNATPSMAWHTPGQPAAATQLMYSTKQQMLADMVCLLRLQDRYPPAAATAAATAATAALTSAAAAARAGQVNPVLLQAASQAYFGSRLQVASMVEAVSQHLAAAAAAAPARQDVEAAVEQGLQRLSRDPEGKQTQQLQAAAALLQAHTAQIVQVECELQSCGGWQSLLPHMPCVASRQHRQQAGNGKQLHASRADAALRAWMRLRSSQGV